MRVWTAFMVFSAIAFGSGGVAYRPRAEPQSTPTAPAVDLGIEVTAADADADAPRCQAPRGSGEFVIDLSRIPRSPGFVSLNTQGYLYRMPNENAHQQVPAAIAKP